MASELFYKKIVYAGFALFSLALMISFAAVAHSTLELVIIITESRM